MLIEHRTIAIENEVVTILNREMPVHPNAPSVRKIEHVPHVDIGRVERRRRAWGSLAIWNRIDPGLKITGLVYGS